MTDTAESELSIMTSLGDDGGTEIGSDKSITGAPPR
jgi:hypothetical protein